MYVHIYIHLILHTLCDCMYVCRYNKYVGLYTYTHLSCIAHHILWQDVYHLSQNVQGVLILNTKLLRHGEESHYDHTRAAMYVPHSVYCYVRINQIHIRTY